MMNNYNFPPQLTQLIKGGNPQQMALNMLKNMNNPITNNVVDLYNKGQYGVVEEIGRNLCKSKGINPDEMISQLKQYM